MRYLILAILLAGCSGATKANQGGFDQPPMMQKIWDDSGMRLSVDSRYPSV